MRLLSLSLAALAATTLLGCGPAAQPRADAAPPPPPSLAASYQLTSHLDPVTAGLLGGRAAAALALLGELEQHPGRTLIAAAELAGVEILGDVRRLLPAALAAKLTDGLDQALRGDGAGRFDGLSARVAALREMAQVVVLHSVLTPQSPQAALHQPVAVGFALPGAEVQVPLPAALRPALPPAVASLGVQAEGPTLALGPHRFAVPFGAMLLEAAGPTLWRPLGGETLADALVARGRCGDTAQRLAETCVAGVCLGKLAGTERLEHLCVAGLRAVAAQVTERIRGADLEVIDMAAGTAILAPGGLRDGRWQLRVRAGDRDFAGSAAFSGIAQPSAAGPARETNGPGRTAP